MQFSSRVPYQARWTCGPRNNMTWCQYMFDVRLCLCVLPVSLVSFAHDICNSFHVSLLSRVICGSGLCRVWQWQSRDARQRLQHMSSRNPTPSSADSMTPDEKLLGMLSEHCAVTLQVAWFESASVHDVVDRARTDFLEKMKKKKKDSTRFVVAHLTYSGSACSL